MMFFFEEQEIYTKSVKRGVERKKKRLSPVSLSLFSLVPDLLFDCSRLLEYAEIRTVLQSNQLLNIEHDLFE